MSAGSRFTFWFAGSNAPRLDPTIDDHGGREDRD